MKLMKTIFATTLFLAAGLSQAAVVPVPFTFNSDGDGAATFQVKGAVSKTFSFDLTEKTLLNTWWSIRQTAANSATISNMTAVLASVSKPTSNFSLGNFSSITGVKNIDEQTKEFTLEAGSYTVSFTGLATTGYKGTGTLTLNAVPVPEPETYALMGLGLVALMARRRKAAK